MPKNTDERKERLSDLGKAAIGVGAAAVFFSRSEIGREVASAGVSRMRNAMLKTSEEMRGQTLKSMWGHGASDLKHASNTFKKAFNAKPSAAIPIRTNNLVGALAKRRQFLQNGDKYVTELFNKEYFPNVLKKSLQAHTDPSDKVMQRRNYEIIDDLMTRRNKNISSELTSGEKSIPVFTDKFLKKINNYYGDKSDDVTVALMKDLHNIDRHKEEFAKGKGDAVLKNIRNQLDDVNTYTGKFKQNTFWNNLVSQQSATVNDVLKHKDQFASQKIGNESIVDIFDNLVKKDGAFGNLVVDPTLKYKNGKFYNYSALGDTLDDLEGDFLSGVGRIIKPLEVSRHIRKSPNFFLTPKGTIDDKLQAVLEPGKEELEHSYLRLFDKTYRVNDNGTLEHMESIGEKFYLTPAKGFEGQHMRRIAGNVDYNIHDKVSGGDITDFDSLVLDMKDKLDLIGPVSKNYTKQVKKLKRNKRLFEAAGLDSSDLSNTYDDIVLSLEGRRVLQDDPNSLDYVQHARIYEHVRTLIEDIGSDENTVLPSKRALEKIQSGGVMSPVKERMRLILSEDEEILEHLLKMQQPNRVSDLWALAESYQKNPIEALERTFYHGKQKNDFMFEVKQELFKEASYSSDINNHIGHFISSLEKMGLSESDLTKAKQLTYLGYLQQTSGIGSKSPNIISDAQISGTIGALESIFSSGDNGDMQDVFKRISQESADKHLAETLKENFLQDNVAIARRPSQYVYMERGVNVLDIIEGINISTLEAGKRAISFAGQFFAGRDNMQDVTTATLYPYFGLFRLQNDLKRTGLGLDKDSMGSVADLAKNIFTKRALPVYALGFGASYLNFEAENLFGRSFTNMAAEATAKIDLGARKILDTFGMSNQLKDAYYWFTPLNYIQDQEYQTSKERKEWYENGYSPVKQSKFWALGSSEFFGGRTLYYQPNYVKRSQVNWKDIGIYGSSDEKWKHSLIPTLRHPLSTVRYLTNPYWLEQKHKYDRPYMVSGPMFDPNTPWGAIGNLSIGNLIKPQKRLNKEFVTSRGIDVRDIIERENNRIKDQARNSGAISIKSGDTAIETVSSGGIGYKGGVPGTGVMATYAGATKGVGGYVTRQEYRTTYLDLSDKLQVFMASAQTSRDRVLNQIERMNYAVKEKAKWSYGNDTQFMVDINNTKVNTDAALVLDKNVRSDLRNITSNQDMIKDITYSIGQLSGVYNFLGESILPSKKRFAYARSSDMYAKSNRFWESGIDGADHKGVMEIVRRFIPHEDRNRIRVNPLRNNMPSWMPNRFMVGDPYASIKKGEMRLPGKGYEALNGLDDKSGFKINSDFIGMDADYIINKTIGANNGDRDFINEYQSSLLASGQAIAVNKGVNDTTNNVAGTYDALIYDPNNPNQNAVLQFKTVDEDIYNSLSLSGANRQDLANVNYYLGQEKLGTGYMAYINKTTKEMMTFDVNFSQTVYQESLLAVREAREKLTKSVKKGILSPFELYDDMTRFKILADIAPGSAEYKNYKQLMQGNLATEADKKEFESILGRVEKQSQKHKFFNYKFTNVKMNEHTGVIESVSEEGIKLVGDDITYKLAGLKNYNEKLYNYLAPGEKVRLEYEKNYNQSKYINAAFYANGLNINRQMARDGSADKNNDGSAMATRALLTHQQILLGKPFEMLSHMPIPIIHNKFLKVDTPYESWMRENIYGTKFGSWDHPIKSILRPAFQQAWGSSLAQGILGTSLFALNEYVRDISITAGQKKAIRLAHLAFTPGAFVGDITERVLKLTPGHSTGTGAMIGTVVGLTGMMLANSQNPFIATASGAGVGFTLSRFLDNSKSARAATAIGAAVGLSISAVKTKGFNKDELFTKYIPKNVKDRWDIEEYFDRLEYLKYKGLYEKASRLALSEEDVPIDKILTDLDKKEKKSESSLRRLNLAKDSISRSNLSDHTKYALLDKVTKEISLYANPDVDVPATPYVRLALGYKQAMESTVFGLDDSSSWAQTLRALEPYERDYFLEFAKETNPRKQKQILKSIAPNKRKILENAWGKASKKKQVSNTKYFKSHRLPGPFWKGWNADSDLEAYKVKTIMNEGMMLSDFGYYDSEKDKPAVRNATPIAQYDQRNALLLRTNLISIMNGMGITDNDVSILPSQQSGIRTFINVSTVNLQKYKNALNLIGAQFY